MSEPANAAARLAAVLDRVVAVASMRGDGTTVVDVWAEALEAPGTPGSHERVTEVARALGLAVGQLHAARRAMHVVPRIRAERYRAQLDQIEGALNAVLLQHPWGGVKAGLVKPNLDTLHHLADALPDDETALAKDVMGEILRAAAELEDLVRTGGIAPEVQAFVFALIDAIRKALRDYPLTGVAALRRAAHGVLTTVADYAEVVQRQQKTKPVRRALLLAGAIWSAVRVSGNAVVKIGELGQGLDRIEAMAPVAQRVMHIRSASEPKRLPAPAPTPPSAPADVTATR